MIYKDKIILTGDRPTGSLHLGHFIGSLKTRVFLQDNNHCYIMIADNQAYTDNPKNTQKVKNSIFQVVRDYVSVGIDPNKTTIFLQSSVPELSELTMIFMNMVNLNRLENNPTIKHEMSLRSFNQSSIPAGFLCYPISQAADILGFNAHLVPAGDDQSPMIELAGYLAKKINIHCDDMLNIPEILLSKTSRLVGIDGKEKASKSLNNAIFLSDTEVEVRKKVMSMYTDPNHLKISDPGNVNGHAVFAYLTAFHPDTYMIFDLKRQYRKGGLGDVFLKKMLIDTLEQEVFSHIRKRPEISDDDIICLLKDGKNKARNIVSNNLDSIKKGLGMFNI